MGRLFSVSFVRPKFKQKILVDQEKQLHLADLGKGGRDIYLLRTRLFQCLRVTLALFCSEI